MRVAKATTLTFCSLLTLLCIQGVAAERNSVPKKLIASCGGTWTGFYHVELDGTTLLYWHDYAPYGRSEKDSAARIKPSSQSWSEFRRALDAIGIWRWRSDYSAGWSDSTRWMVEIEYSDHSIKSGGDSSTFPDKEGVPCPRDDQYTRYVKAMRKLLGRDSFPEEAVRSNQSMQRTAGRSACPLSMTSTFSLQRRVPSPAVADLGSR